MQDLLGLAQFPVLPLLCLHLLGHIGRDAPALAAGDLGLLDPLIQGLGVQPICAAIDITACQRDAC